MIDLKFSTLPQTFSLPYKFKAIDWNKVYNLGTIEILLQLLDYMR